MTPGRSFPEVQVETVSDLEDLGEDSWNDLLGRAEGCSIFQSYGWIHAWWNTFSDNRRQLLVLLAVLDEKIVGIAPLFLERDANRPTSCADIRFIGEGHADYLNFLVDKETPYVVDTLLGEITRMPSSWSHFYANEIPESSRLGLALQKLVDKRYHRLRALGRTPCPSLNIADHEEYLSSILRKQSIRRNTARILKMGELKVQHHCRKEDIVLLLNDFFQQHIDRWSVTNHPSLFLKQENRSFYHRLVDHLCKEGKLIFTSLALDGRAIAYHLGLVSGSDFLWYKPSFDITLAQYSPGEILLKELFVMAFERKFRRFDFTRGDEAFKKRFADQITYNVSFTWYRRRSELFADECKAKTKALLRTLVNCLPAAGV